MISRLPRFVLLLAAPVMLALLGAASQPSWPHTIARQINSGRSLTHVQLVEIGGCEYVVASAFAVDGGVAIIHHAACTNPAHTKTP